MLVKVADRFKQPLEHVLLSPFAFTLWSYIQVLRLEREEGIEKMRQRLDMAGLIAGGFHEPSSLRKYEIEYLRQAGVLKSVLESAKERAVKLVEEHKNLKVVATVQPKRPPRKS